MNRQHTSAILTKDLRSAYQTNGHHTNRLRCMFCCQEKRASAFSDRQLAKAGYYNGSTKRQAICMQCTPKQTVSLTCAGCFETKPCEKFSKKQRKNPEEARCLECMRKREEEDVNDSDYISY